MSWVQLVITDVAEQTTGACHVGWQRTHGKREGKRRDFVGFKNKHYENASCGLVVQNGAVDVIIIWGTFLSFPGAL